jgi:hypothetical protein
MQTRYLQLLTFRAACVVCTWAGHWFMRRATRLWRLLMGRELELAAWIDRDRLDSSALNNMKRQRLGKWLPVCSPYLHE